MKPIYIKTYEQFIETFGKVNEGGNALDTTQRIANKYIPNTLEFITAKILPVIGLEGFNIDAAVVGSAGKKDPDVTSGDIDIAVSLDKIAGHAGIDVKGVLKYINDALSAKGYETNIQYGFHQVNVAVPIDGDSKKGYCQVDLMVTDNLDWSKFIYFSPDYRKAESRYSGAFRGMLINAIASEGMKKAVKHDEESGEMEEYEQMVNRATHGLFQVRKTLRGKRGLVKTPKLMKDYEKKITNIPEEAIKILFGEGVKAKDVESFEGIWKVMHGNQFPFPGKRETIANKFLWYMKNMEIPVPTEIVKKYPNLIKENNTDMKRHVKLYEDFVNEAKKEYFQDMSPEEFAKIRKGDKVQYMGGTFTVDSTDGYVLGLKDNRGKVRKVNLGQFIHGGRIKESVNEGMSKNAIKKSIKVIDKQIDTETGGDGEPLDNETLQALEKERERLESMLEGKSINEGNDKPLFERKKVLADREGNKDTGNKLLDAYLKGLAAGTIQVAYNMLTVSNGVLDTNRSANYTIGFDQFSDEWRVFGNGFESRSTSKDSIKNSEDLYKFITMSVNGFAFTNESIINEAEEKQGKELVNIMVGRFQPFHNGHYLAAKELHDKNGLPVVLASVRAKGKTGKGTSFTDATMDKMMKDVIKKSGFIIDNVEIPFVAFDTKLFPALRPKYEPVLFGAGEDRVATYDRQRISMRDKHKNKLNMRDDFEIQLTGRYGSGTAVRNAIEKGDQKEFESTMPKFLHNYWETLSSELGMNESKETETIEEVVDGPVEKPIDRISRTIDDCKADLAKTGASIERLKFAIENGAKEPKVMESLTKLTKIHGSLLIEMATFLSEGKLDNEIKSMINQYTIMDDPYDVAESMGKKFGWDQKKIEQAEKIIRKKYIK